jgi:glycine oxidase
VPFDAVFVGGGVIGLSGAWEAARRGLKVAVVDPDPGHGASWVAAGMLAPVTEATYGEGALTRLLLEAAAQWPAFAAALGEATGHDVGFRPCGTITVAADPSDRSAIDRLLEYQQSLGLGAERRSAAECRHLVPALSPGVSGGAEVPGDHQVDNRKLVEALLAACRSSGVELVAQRVARIDCDSSAGTDRVRSLELSSGEQLASATVVLAAGCESPLVPGLPPRVVPPVRPVKGHTVRLAGSDEVPLLSRTVRALVHGRSCYLVPRRDGSVVIGSTMEERGFDRTVQAGAVHQLLSDARTAVPGIDELELVDCCAGLRPATPDNGPIVGATEVDGLLVATGHFRNGILLAPLTAAAVAELLAGGGSVRSVAAGAAGTGARAVAALAAFGPDRFGSEGARDRRDEVGPEGASSVRGRQ